MTEPASAAFVPAPAGVPGPAPGAPAAPGLPGRSSLPSLPGLPGLPGTAAAPPAAAGLPGAGGQFGASLDVMAQAAAHVGTVNEEIAALLSTLLAQLEPIAATWKGAASSAFQHLHQRWNTDARKLNAALGGISESLSGTHRRYAAAEESNTTAVNRVAGLIG